MNDPAGIFETQSETAPLPPEAADCCGTNAFALVGTAPKVGPFPELHTWRCSCCGHVVTVEAR
jgi:hypothetical protein